MKPLDVLSFGSGVQSSTTARMSFAGLLPPLDAAVFADTGHEPPAVYAHLWSMASEFLAAGVPLYVASGGDLREVALSVETRSGTLPLFLKNEDGSQGRAKRDCTVDFKVMVIRRVVRRLHLAAGRRPVRQWIGISWDESERMRDSEVQYISHYYPLIDHTIDGEDVRLRRDMEHGISRRDCLAWNAARGFPRPPRSACYFCPNTKTPGWRRLRDSDPETFARAVEFERELQAAHAASTSKMSLRGVPFLHRDMVPLDQVDLRSRAEKGEPSFPGMEWDDDEDETDGCGVLCPSEGAA